MDQIIDMSFLVGICIATHRAAISNRSGSVAPFGKGVDKSAASIGRSTKDIGIVECITAICRSAVTTCRRGVVQCCYQCIAKTGANDIAGVGIATGDCIIIACSCRCACTTVNIVGDIAGCQAISTISEEVRLVDYTTQRSTGIGTGCQGVRRCGGIATGVITKDADKSYAGCDVR